MKILIINGPNLNLLGKRDKNNYGSFTLKQLNDKIKKWYKDISFDFYQSNIEGKLIDKLQEYKKYDGIVINPGAFTHYSIAIRDCIEVIDKPIIEVHLSNVYNREKFREKSVISPVCDGKISGLKADSYLLAIDYIRRKND
ncbi:MAG: type II 3-dehydroquinate dehydratase [Bacillota bacterium]